MTAKELEELQSAMVKIALDASKEGYNQGVLTAANVLRKVLELNPQHSGVLKGCIHLVEDLIKEKMK